MEKETVESPIMVLPKELMFEILFRDESSNPLELMRVSKLWKSLVLDPYFVEKHMKKSFTDIAFLFAKAMKPWNAFRSQHFIQKEEEVVDKEEEGIEEEEKVVDEEKEAIEEEETIDDEEKEKFIKLAKGVVIVLNNDLATLSSIKRKMEALNVEMEAQPMEDRIKSLRSFVLVYIKSTTSSSSSSH